MVTINDIAQQAGVSKSTVSRYLNGGSISKKTKVKIDQIVKETGYSPNTFAQSLKAKNTKMVGIIIPRLNSYSANTVLSSIDRKLREKGYQLLITNTDQNLDREIENIYTLAKQKVEGIILMATVITERHRKAIADVEIPVLLLGQQAKGLHSIGHQEYEAGYKIGEYAGKLGHKNFLYLNVFKEDIAVGQSRARGVYAALNNWSDVQIETVETSFSFQNAYELALEILPKTKASYIICATDNIATAVLKAAHNLSLSIPEDFSLSGFGGHEVTSIVSPSITTIKYSHQALGETAVEQLFRLISGEEIKENSLMPNTLVVRESTVSLIKR